MKKIAFIINPISGGVSKHKIPDQIKAVFSEGGFSCEILHTKSSSHNKELALEAARSGFDTLVAVGGDGTINHVAGAIANTGISLGIVPLGSGNGLARHLGIPMSTAEALQIIKRGQSRLIDSGFAGDRFFVNLAGAGFDAHVSDLFANAPKRGFWSYTQITLREFAKFKSEEVIIRVDGKEHFRKAFIVCVANGSQYGNNAYVAPKADLSDGVFTVSILKPFPVHHMPGIGLKMFARKFDQSKYVETFEGRNIELIRTNDGAVHIDGEPTRMDKKIHFTMNPDSVKIIVP